MFNFVFLIFGILIGVLVSPAVGGCDGSFWTTIKGAAVGTPSTIEKLRDGEEQSSIFDNFTFVSSAYATEIKNLTPVPTIADATAELEREEKRLKAEPEPELETVTEILVGPKEVEPNSGTFEAEAEEEDFTEEDNGELITIEHSDVWIPTVLEKHTSSLDMKRLLGKAGFGSIESCDMTKDDCFYVREFSSTPLHHFIDRKSVINEAVESMSNVMLYEIQCLDQRYLAFLPIQQYDADARDLLLDSEMKDAAAEWDDAVIQRLSLAVASNVLSAQTWDVLHDELLSFHYDDKEFTLSKARIGHPAGDIYMLNFQIALLTKVVEKMNLYRTEEQTKNYCSAPS